MRSLQRNQHAYRLTTQWSRDLLESVAALAKGYPIVLRTLGLLQTLAFSLSKRESAHAKLAEALADWVLSKECGAPLGVVAQEQRSPSRLLELLATAPRSSYLAADMEAVAYADVLKLMAQAQNIAKSSGMPSSPDAPAGASSVVSREQ